MSSKEDESLRAERSNPDERDPSMRLLRSARNDKGRRALFLDRDGIFNEVVMRDGVIASPRSWEEIHFYPDAARFQELKLLDFVLVLVTNQPDIERGITTQEFVDDVHRHIKETYKIDAVYCCPFSSNDHADKKPNPGMLFRASKDLQLSLADSFFLGDTKKDVGAAKRCGCQSILWDRPYNKKLKADHRIITFVELKSLLESANKKK
jgi:D-glycero-D-manno-heptose 1,7-bisphosphate phosphatase